jgi:hypothetical protein
MLLPSVTKSSPAWQAVLPRPLERLVRGFFFIKGIPVSSIVALREAQKFFPQSGALWLCCHYEIRSWTVWPITQHKYSSFWTKVQLRVIFTSASTVWTRGELRSALRPKDSYLSQTMSALSLSPVTIRRTYVVLLGSDQRWTGYLYRTQNQPVVHGSSVVYELRSKLRDASHLAKEPLPPPGIAAFQVLLQL